MRPPPWPKFDRVGAHPLVTGLAVAAVALVATGSLWLARTPQATIPADSATTQSAAETRAARAAIGTVRRAWLSELERVRELARGIAGSRDTAEFVRRPNLPFVDDHFPPERLRALGIDTVLVVDAKREPIFWRRPNDRANEGFPDAERFLAAMPDFTRGGASVPQGEPVLEGAVRFPRGTTLATVMPIVADARGGVPVGYLVFGRTLDGAPARRIVEAASAPIDTLAPGDAQLGASVRQRLALASELVPIVVADADAARGYLPVHDVLGRLERVYAVALPHTRPVAVDASADSRTVADTGSNGTSAAWRSGAIAALLLLAAAAAAAAWLWTRSRVLRERVQRTAGGHLAAALAGDSRAGGRGAVAAAGIPVLVEAVTPESRPPPAVQHIETPPPHPAGPDDAVLRVDPAHAERPFEDTRDDAFVEQVLVRGGDDEPVLDDIVVAADAAPLALDVHVEETAPPPAVAALPTPVVSPPVLVAVATPRVVTSLPRAAARETATPAMRHAALVRGLVEAGRVHVHYQPQIGMRTGAIVGVEALLRWQDESAVLRSAAELFDVDGPEPFAAATEFVLRRACADRRSWLSHVSRTLPVSVNVGLGELRDPGFLERVARILAEAELAPALLELEVPEAALASDVEADTLERAHRMGIGIAIGAFIAADAPLRAITRVPVAKLKLARMLVGQLPDDTHTRTVVDEILAIGRTLGVAVCAEGVETAAQAEYLELRHCPLAQGWHYGHALAADRFLDLLKESGVDTMRLPLMDVEELESHARATGMA